MTTGSAYDHQTVTCVSCRAHIPVDSRFCERCQAYQPGNANPADQPLRATIDDAVVDGSSPNDIYIGNRLRYSDFGTSFDPVANPAYQRALKAQLATVAALWFLGSFGLFIVFGILGIIQWASVMQGSFYGQSSATGAPVFMLWLLLWFGWTVTLIVVFLVRRLPVQLTEWMLTVDGAGRTAGDALDHMSAILTARQTPLRDVRPIGVRPPGQPPRRYLQVDDPPFTGFVSCFAYGVDLFIGWTYWLNLAPGQWLLLAVRQLFRGGNDIQRSLVYDQPKALREVMHSVVRQGVDVASNG